MGVPKFYRWISERYPCLSETVKENQIPEFDNLYLDMNGIIHTCSHPNDDDPHFRITEEQIFKDIFRYLEVLFRIIRPRKVFFMAVDGVAPRAKMNQQRGRRFMSAKTAEELIEQAKKRGEKLPSEERFDSNCITPGTPFMAKLHEQLKYFVNMKITTDEMWQGLRIYLSGHDVPGEGEHKIMDFIRHERSQSGYDPYTRHCLYGLDADLIMLGMCSHEPYFALLREEVKFVRARKGAPARTANAEQTTFHLLHLSLLRDYLELEFGIVKDNLPFAFDLESIIDDWVFMGFLVGNDFIPHLPNLHIHSNALPTLYKAYLKVLPELGGYINEKGFLNLPRFEKFLSVLTQFDRDRFSDEYDDLKWLEGKSSLPAPRFPSRDIRQNVPRTLFMPKKLVLYTDSDSNQVVGSPVSNQFKSTSERDSNQTERDSESWDMAASSRMKASSSGESDDISQLPDELRDLVLRSDVAGNSSDTSEDDDVVVQPVVGIDEASGLPVVNYDYELCGGDDDDESWTPDMEKKFMQFKKDYYKNKMNFERVSPEVLRNQAFEYVRAIQWNLHYYYNGICSWSWFYPHHYAPYLSDVKGFADMKLEFELGEPFLPFQQLLAVLPAASRKLLPPAYQPLMTDSSSPVIDFYPTQFETDLNGKKNDWEAVILIPFIAEGRLLKAMTPLSALLTDEEKARNQRGKHLLYTTAAQDQGFYRTPLMGVLPDLEHNKAICMQLDREVFRLSPSRIRKGLLPGIRLDMYFLGFSTLKHIPHTGTLMNMGVKVFEQNSKNESMMIQLLADPKNEIDLAEVARRILGKEVYVNWPHLSAGMVCAVVADGKKFSLDKTSNNAVCTDLITKELRLWDEQAEEIKNRYEQQRAVQIGDVKILVYIKRLLGRKYVCSSKGEITMEKQWGELPATYALQTVVENVNVRDTMFTGMVSNIDELFPVGCKLFLVSNPFYGCAGVIEDSFDKEKGRFRIQVTDKAEPDFSKLIANQERIGLYWYPGWQAAQKLNISGHFLSRLTGTIYVKESTPSESSNGGNKYNIGLNLKFGKKNEEVPDYTKRDVDNVWYYSTNVLKIMDEYLQKFPEVCDYLHGKDSDGFSVEEIWKSAECKGKLKELLDWLKSLPCHNLRHQAIGTECIDERVIRAIDSAVKKTKTLLADKTKTLVVRPNVLFRCCMAQGSSAPDPRADYRLFDRVVCAREGYTVPIGLRGTVVGIHPGRHEGDTKLSVIFDEEFIGGTAIRGNKNNGYQIMSSALINLSFGVRLEQEKKQQKQEIASGQQRQVRSQQDQQSTSKPVSVQPKEDRRRVQPAPQAASAQPKPGQVRIFTKSQHSAFQATQHTGTPYDQSHHRPTLQKSMSESHKTVFGNSLQGKSIMNEIFPNRVQEEKAAFEPKPASAKKEAKKLEESSQALRSLLNVGSAKGGESKKYHEGRGKPEKKADHGSRHWQQNTPKTPQSEPRVPFTARQPQPPPFAPTFTPDLSPSSQPQVQQPSVEPTSAQHQQAGFNWPSPLFQISQQRTAASQNLAGQQSGQQQMATVFGQNQINSTMVPTTQQLQQQTTVPLMHPTPQQATGTIIQQTHPQVFNMLRQLPSQHQPPRPPLLMQPPPQLGFNPILLPNAMLPIHQPQPDHSQQRHGQFQHHLLQQQQFQQQPPYLQQRFHSIPMQQAPMQPLPVQPPPPQGYQVYETAYNEYQQNVASQRHRDHNNMPGGSYGRQRRTSNSAGGPGHEQFVPLQVTKKQPAPAYVKGIGAKAAVDSSKGNGTGKAMENQAPSAENRSHGGKQKANKPQEADGGENKGSGTNQQKPAAASTSTRPKSRLAIKLADVPSA